MSVPFVAQHFAASFAMAAVWVVGFWTVWCLGARRGLLKHARAPGSTGPDPYVFGDGAATFVTAARVGWVSVTLPLARVTVDERHLRLRAWLLPFFPDVAVDRGEVLRVTYRGRRLGAELRFETVDGRLDGVRVIVGTAAELVAVLQRTGWPVVLR